jgi:hypothetical protein
VQSRLHSALLFGEQRSNIVLEQETALFQLFKDLVARRLVFGFDAPDVAIDLVVGCGEAVEFVIRFGEPLDQPRHIGELILQFVRKPHGNHLLLNSKRSRQSAVFLAVNQANRGVARRSGCAVLFRWRGLCGDDRGRQPACAICSSRRASLFGCEPQLWAMAILGVAQACLMTGDVVAGHGDHSLAFDQLDLEHHHALFAEGHFRRREIELPHSAKAVVVKAFCLFAPRHESLAPSLERIGVVEAQNLDVSDQQSGALNRW